MDEKVQQKAEHSLIKLKKNLFAKSDYTKKSSIYVLVPSIVKEMMRSGGMPKKEVFDANFFQPALLIK